MIPGRRSVLLGDMMLLATTLCFFLLLVPSEVEELLESLRGRPTIIEFPEIDDLGVPFPSPGDWSFLQASSENITELSKAFDLEPLPAFLYLDRHGNLIHVDRSPRRRRRVEGGMAELERRVRSRPGYIRYLAYRGSDEGRISTQTLWSADGGELTITSVESRYAFVTPTFRRAREDELIAGVDAPQWKVETLLRAEAPVGRINALLVVQVEHPVLDEVRIPLVGFVHPVVVARPDDLFFGDVVIGNGVESRLELEIHSQAGIELLSAETTVPGVLVELGSAENDEGETHHLKVLLTPDLLTGPFRGVVRVRTTSSELPVLEIPISGVAQ